MESDSTGLDIVALDDLVLPEAANDFFLVLWGLSEVGCNFLQMEVTLSLVTIGHVLGRLLRRGRRHHCVDFKVGN